jgi:DNA ligase (NAD+)
LSESDGQSESQQRLEELGNLLLYHSNLYYNQGVTEISDAEYDGLQDEYDALVLQHPEHVKEVISEQVGAPPEGALTPFKHVVPMLSLDKVHTPEDLQAWLEKYPSKPMIAWPKFDGVSLTLIYKQGALTSAATRGNGQVGKNVTAHVTEIENVLSQLEEAFNGEIRGEVVMKKSVFEAYNKAHPDKPLANPRNGAAGSLLAKDRDKVKDRTLTFYAYEVVDYDHERDNPVDALKALGYKIEDCEQFTLPSDGLAYSAKLAKARDSLDYEVDGSVFRIASSEDFNNQGVTSHHSRGSIAYKMTAETVEAKLSGVFFQVGRGGAHTPVGELENPVLVAGARVKRATLHNMEEIKRRDIRIGDRVVVQRAGDVIPQITKPVSISSRDGSEKAITGPTSCISCNSPLVERGPSKVLVCVNHAACPAQGEQRLVYWVGKDGADMKSVGPAQLARLKTAGLVKRPSDLYTLTREQVLELDQTGERGAERMIESIQGTKDLGMRRALICLNIPGSSKGTAKRLALAGYKSVEEVANADEESLAVIEDIGPIGAKNIRNHLNSPSVQEEIARLREVGVSLDVHEDDKPKVISVSSHFTGKKVVLTGSLSVPRTVFAKQLEEVGAKVSSSISANTDILIAGENAGSKLAKAEKHGVKVMDESTARSLLTP